MRIRSTPKRIFRTLVYVSRFSSLMKLFFWRKVFSKRFAPLCIFFNPLYSFTFLVWDGLNDAFDYWPIVVDDTYKYGVFEEVRIVKFFNPFVTKDKALLCNKTLENYTQIYPVRKLVPKCAYLSRTEIRLTRVTIVCYTLPLDFERRN
jgi:hypothetical protein